MLGTTEIELAITAAQRAQISWYRLATRDRSTILKRWHGLVMDNLDDLAVLMTAEQGKPLVEAKGEIQYAVSFIEWLAEEAKRVYGEIVPSPLVDRRFMVVGLGGGSSLDVAKLLAVLLPSGQQLVDIYGIGKVQGQRLPLVQIPTTVGACSEVTNISIITTGAATKMGAVSPQQYADFVLLDAQLTLGLPRIATAATAIDAMVHAIEAYTSKFKKTRCQTPWRAKRCGCFQPACKDGGNREAREALLLGATLAGQAFANSPVAAVHALAYPLGSHYHVAHGLSNALMLGPVLKFNMVISAHQYAELACVIGVPGQGNTEKRAEDFIQAIDTLMTQSGSLRRLRDVGVTEDSLGMLADEAMKQTRLLVNNPTEVHRDDALALHSEVY